jgi:hypothetical protein
MPTAGRGTASGCQGFGVAAGQRPSDRAENPHLWRRRPGPGRCLCVSCAYRVRPEMAEAVSHAASSGLHAQPRRASSLAMRSGGRAPSCRPGADPPAHADAVFDMALGGSALPVRAAYRARATRAWSQPFSLASHAQPGRRSRRSTCSFREPRPTWLPPGETHPERRLHAHRPRTSPINEHDPISGRACDPIAE